MKKYQVTYTQVLRHLIGAIFACFLSISCSKSRTTKELQIAEDLLWSKPDSCLAFLEGIDYSSMSEHDSLACALMREHALFKIEYGLENDSMLHVLKDYFEAQGDHRYAGEACYIIGRNLELQQNLPMATFYQKAAEEHLLKAKDVPSQLLGMVYYGLGCSAEYERLFEVATDYYRKALPYFIDNNDSLYISCTYRDIAESNPLSEQTIAMFDSALQYIPASAWNGYQLEINTAKGDYILQDNPRNFVNDYSILCDSLHLYRYAIELCRYYLSEYQLDSVPYYLSLAELDTANSVWSKEHYLFNKAWYNYEIGQKDSAYFILRDLHLWQTEEIESSAYTRSYMVEQRYDAERERADKLLAEAGKRRAYLVIVIIVTVGLLIMAVLLLMLQQERMKKRQKEEQLRQKQLLLQEQLKTRLSISAELKKQHDSGQKFTEKTYNRIVSSIVYIHSSRWEALMQEFDVAYAGLLTDLSARFTLTDVDKLYVVLIILGCSNEDISQLVNVTVQSVKNRKILLKQHLETDLNLKEMLQEEARRWRGKTPS